MHSYPMKMLSFVIAISVSSASCTSLKLPRYAPRPLDSYRNAQTIEGLVVGVTPIVDEAESRQYFGTNLLASGILAVFVMAENRHPQFSFIVSREAVVLQAEATSRPQRIGDPRTSDQAAEGLGMAGALLVSPILLGVAVKLASDVSVINHNIRDQEFQTKTLSPGQRAEGFFYFQVPKDTERAGTQWTLSVLPRRVGDGENSPFLFTIDQKEKGR